MQLKVVKADGSEEEYLHTKVIATFVNALAGSADNEAFVAQELAETVTFYLYNKYDRHKIAGSEIFSIIQAVLSSTGYSNAAVNLAEYHHKRNLLRSRIEVIKSNTKKISNDLKSRKVYTPENIDCWNKSRIVNDMIIEYNFDIATARTIGSLVEEKIINSGLRRVPTEFIDFLAVSQAQAIFSAQQQLRMPVNKETIYVSEDNTAREGRLRQPQNGLCPVEV